ncbi:hypothetical protein BDN70DRAFT_881154 [Pholiota conissans]|uniref:Uncharacterized protein n=1 Tax=Pholiota conissans TaxID=109636 RepID=A0A9P6CYM5_9AGAR|nr:hypothetical protein BDN70DRAFT_881154 [Pholiota conissans]
MSNISREESRALSRNQYRQGPTPMDDNRMDVDSEAERTSIALERSLENLNVRPMDDAAGALSVSTRVMDTAPSGTSHPLVSSPEPSANSIYAGTSSSTATQGFSNDNELSSSEYMPGEYLSVESPSSSIDPPPPTYSSAVKQGRAKPICIICEKKPAYNDGVKAYPTCGNSCARKLEAIQGLDQRHPYSYTHEQGYSRSRSPPIKMCIVCKTRPQYEKGGKSYETCGLTCAAKLSSSSIDKCEFCQIKAKAYDGYNKKAPYCSITCRDKAQKRAAAVASSSTCSTCLICWKAARVGDRNDFCSPACHAVYENNSPGLFEIPRGHISFRRVSDHCSSSWKDTNSSVPAIKKIYMVGISAATEAAHLAYQSRVEQLSRGIIRAKTSNTKSLWIGVSRECLFGDTGVVDPCASTTCYLCSLVRTAIHPQIFAKGIKCTDQLDRALAYYSKNRKQTTSNLAVLANVVLGNEAEISIDEDIVLPQGHDSIRLLQRRGGLLSGKVSYQGAYIVFAAEAVRPVYIISYDFE